MIPLRWKIYALAAIAFVLALLGVRASIIHTALAHAEAARNLQNLNAVKKARERDAELNQMDDVSLAEHASKWLRSDGE